MTKKHKSAAHTSKADRVLDALQEVRKEQTKPGYCCNKCGNFSYTSRRPLGGPLIMTCTECGHKQHKGAKHTTALQPENLNHKQGTSRGPTWSASNSPKTDKHSPAYRGKGKGRPND